MGWENEYFFGKKAGMFLNSAYKGVAGESISQYVGSGRVTNIFGRDQKFVFDWNYLLNSFPKIQNVTAWILPNGGTSSINLGANHSINFGGVHLLTAKIGSIGAKVTVDVGKPDEKELAKLLDYEAKYRSQHLIAYAVGLISITVFMVCLLRWEDFTTNPEKIENWGKSIDSCKFAVVTGSFIVIDVLYKFIISVLQEIGIADAATALIESERQRIIAEDNLNKRFLAVETRISDQEIGIADAATALIESERQRAVAEDNLNKRFLAVETKISNLESNIPVQVSELMSKLNKVSNFNARNILVVQGGQNILNMSPGTTVVQQ